MTKTIPQLQRKQIIRIFTAENEKKMTIGDNTALILEGYEQAESFLAML